MNLEEFKNRIQDVHRPDLIQHETLISFFLKGEIVPLDEKYSPVFEELDSILEVVCPSISVLRYNAILNQCMISVREEKDFYSKQVKQVKTISVHDLYFLLRGWGYV